VATRRPKSTPIKALRRNPIGSMHLMVRITPLFTYSPCFCIYPVTLCLHTVLHCCVIDMRPLVLNIRLEGGNGCILASTFRKIGIENLRVEILFGVK
jgi:hypothetical protein